MDEHDSLLDPESVQHLGNLCGCRVRVACLDKAITRSRYMRLILRTYIRSSLLLGNRNIHSCQVTHPVLSELHILHWPKVLSNQIGGIVQWIAHPLHGLPPSRTSMVFPFPVKLPRPDIPPQSLTLKGWEHHRRGTESENPWVRGRPQFESECHQSSSFLFCYFAGLVDFSLLCVRLIVFTESTYPP
jgi:hypothetical protein